MIQTLHALASNAALERLTLLLNHVLASEPEAKSRLAKHIGAGIGIELVDWPSLLPPVPTLLFRITPAALLEWCPDGLATEANLRITLDTSNPARVFLQSLAGQRPSVNVSGDAALAADISWLAENLRWDIEDDIAGIVGPIAAHELARFARAAIAAVRDLISRVQAFAAR